VSDYEIAALDGRLSQLKENFKNSQNLKFSLALVGVLYDG
jgi:hypothetical protein